MEVFLNIIRQQFPGRNLDFFYNKKTMRYAVVRSGAKKLPTSTDKN